MTSHAEESKQLLASAEDRLKAASPAHLIEFERIQLDALLSVAHGVQALIELQGLPVFVKTEGFTAFDPKVALEKLDALEETAAILADPETMAAIAEAEAERKTVKGRKSAPKKGGTDGTA